MVAVPCEEGRAHVLSFSQSQSVLWCGCEGSSSCRLWPSSSVLFALVLFGLLSLVTFHRNHGCEIVKVEFLVQQLRKIGRFLTVTKDGIL